jgi:cell division protein FtsI (penicillin-binding protein 3)
MRTRLIALAIIFTVLFVLVVARAFTLQIMDRERLMGKSRQATQKTLTLSSRRGDIFDCHLEKLATSVSSDTISVHGAFMKSPGEVFLYLSQVLDMDYESLAQTLEGARRYAVVKRDISDEESEAVRGLGLEDISIEKGYRRVYPNGTLAAHLLGFVGIDDAGLEGLEMALNDYLLAPEVKIRVTRDKNGRIAMTSADQAREAPKGASVILTLDRRIQFIAEKALAKAVTETNAKRGMAIAVRPRTGEIVASAIYPTFDPSNFAQTDIESRRNIILTDPFEPGSTFKVFTIAAALEEGVVTPESTFFCENGFYKVDGDTVIRDTQAYGDLTVSRIVQVSSNIGACKVGERLGAKKLHNYLTRFAFGEKSNLAYPSGESSGRLRPVKDWHVVDLSNISFGQGISVTALQLVMAVAALGNDGVLMQPMLVARVIDPEGNIVENRTPQIVRQVVSPLTARQVSAMMRMANMRGGTGTRADIPQYPVAGKTGTSQKWNTAAGVYSHDKFVASYVGFAPYENPELCLLVVLDEPWPRYYGGIVAAPVFKEIMEEALPLLDVPPMDRESPPQWPTLDKASLGAPGVLADYSSSNFVRTLIPKGDKGAQGPIPTLEGGPISPVEEPYSTSPRAPEYEPGVMPQVIGLSMRQALGVLAPQGLNLEFKGSGIAFAQEPAAGTKLPAGSYVRIYFRGSDLES